MKKLRIFASVLLLAAMCVTATDLQAASKKPRGKKGKTEQAEAKKEPKPTKYEKMFVKDKNCRTYKGGFATLHLTEQKVYIELPKRILGRDMLIASTISSISDNSAGAVGYKPLDPLHVRFTVVDTVVQMRKVMPKPDFDTTSVSRRTAMVRNTVDPVVTTFKRVCMSPDSTAVVFEATPLFTSATKELSPIDESGSEGLTVKASPQTSSTVILDAHAYEDNLTVLTELSYSVSTSLMGLLVISKDQPVTLTVTRTLLLLPERTMRPRLADSRVGIFLTDRTDYDADADMSQEYSIINRWRLEPADSAAWQRGEKVEPKQHIVYYLDDALPESWREPARRGITRWNKAFEQIGFKNVIEVKDYPKDDKNFNPDNLKYSCVRYAPSPIANAMGPSWIDPRSGEIINASVILYSDVVKLISSWRFSQTAQVDARVRAKRMPADVMDESIEYIIAHEVGHTLGFMHNMAASASYPVDSLRNAAFTQRNGTTASIMDYARFNYVAQPQDKGVSLTPPYLGVYDYFLIKYAYEPIYTAASFKDEAKTLEKWVSDVQGDKRFRYGCQQVASRYDPSAIEEDLGDDPIKAGTYGIKNVKYIMSHFNEWLTDAMDEDGSYRDFQYGSLLTQYRRYVMAAIRNVGGIYLTRTTPATAAQSAVPVPAATQRATVRWVQQQLDDTEWLKNPSPAAAMTLGIDPAKTITQRLMNELMNSYKDVILSSYLAPAKDRYTMRQWLDDMYAWAWKPTLRGAATTAADRTKELAYLNMVLSSVKKAGPLKGLFGLAETAGLPSVEQILTFGLDRTGLVERYADELRALDETYGSGYVAARMLPCDFGPAGYNWQRRVNTSLIDESQMLLYGEVLRVQRLLKSRVGAASGDTRAHYEQMLHTLDDALKSK